MVSPIVGFRNCSMFCCSLLCVHSSCAIILMGKIELVALLSLSSWCLVIVVWIFLVVQRVPRWCFFCGCVCVCLSLTFVMSVYFSPCGRLLEKGWPLDSLVCDIFLRFRHVSIWCPGSGAVLDCIDIFRIFAFSYFVCSLWLCGFWIILTILNQNLNSFELCHFLFKIYGKTLLWHSAISRVLIPAMPLVVHLDPQKNLSSRPLKIKKMWNMHKIWRAHLHFVNNHFAKFE